MFGGNVNRVVRNVNMVAVTTVSFVVVPKTLYVLILYYSTSCDGFVLKPRMALKLRSSVALSHSTEMKPRHTCSGSCLLMRKAGSARLRQ
jgi:hypothetical protein